MYDSILSGDLNGDDIVLADDDDAMADPSRSDNSNHVVIGSYTDPNTILDGFTITAGLAGSFDWPDPNGFGGGMYIYAGEPAISNCNFTENHAAGRGGAIYSYSDSLIATDCTFANNSVSYAGGGVYCDYVVLTDCIFKNNWAGKGARGGPGGGLYTKDARLTGCVFVANSARRGGGMFMAIGLGMGRPGGNRDITRTAELINCVFRDNQAAKTGGGLSIDTEFTGFSANSVAVLTGCVFIRNCASSTFDHSLGGGMYQGGRGIATLTNCIFTENSAEGLIAYGGGLVARGTLINCVFTKNSATNGYFSSGGAMSTGNSTLIDCVFHQNFASGANASGGALNNYGHSSLTRCTFIENSVQSADGFNGDGRGGGAIHNDGDNLPHQSSTIIECVFIRNSAYGGRGGTGGAITNWESHSTLTDCTFTQNFAEGSGGAIDNFDGNPTINNCVFTENMAASEWAGLGGAIVSSGGSKPVVTDCTFNNNLAVGDYARGGAIFGGWRISNCVFKGNSAIGISASGGALYYHWYYDPEAYSDRTLINCLFSGNSVRGQVSKGGAICWPGTSMGCTFVGNSAYGTSEGYGGAVYISYPGEHIAITNCILVDNVDSTGMGQSAQFYVEDGSLWDISYSCVQGWDGQWPGRGNMDAYPMFVDAGYWDPNETPDDISDDTWVHGDYRLGAGSLCIDTGDPDYVGEPNGMDLGGNPRIVNGRVDMGAYEYGVSNTAPVADAGEDMTAYAGVNGAVVVLDGSGSFDADGDELGYLWTWAVGGEVFDANGVRPAIELPVGEHVIELVVNDGVEDSEPNSVLVTVIAPVEAKMFFVPRVINRSSRGRFVMAVMYLPEGIDKGDIVDGSFALYVNGGGSGPIAATMYRSIVNRNWQRVLVVFDRADVIDALPVDDAAVCVDLVADLEDGRYIVGSDTVRIVRPKRRVPRQSSRSAGSRRSGR